MTSGVSSKTVTGAFALIDSLKRHGVKHIFGFPGGAILPVYDEIYSAEAAGELKHILVRHEQGAAHAADGYARATGKVGVCMATSGPGATNLVTGLATAYMDSIPVVAITGQVPRALLGTDGFQEIDIFGITLPIVKHSYIVRRAKDIPRIVAEAFYIASHGRPGPVLIDFPKDVGLEEINYVPVEPGNVLLPGCHITTKANPRQINKALDLILGSKRPLLYVGGGAIISGAYAEIKELAEHFQIPVTTTLMGKGIFDESHPLALGMAGMHGAAYANYAMNAADLIISVGARFDDRITGKLKQFAQTAKVIHIDIDPAEEGKNRMPEVPIVGDACQVLDALLERVRQSGIRVDPEQTKAWRERIQQWREEYPLEVTHSEQGLSPQEVVVELARQCPDACFTTDVGQHQMWAAQFIHNKPRQWLTSGGLGTMGYGVPAAVGAKVALPDKPVICISGDGSFQMNMQELGTIARYNLDLKIVILNNGWLGMVRQWQHLFYGDRYEATDLEAGNPQFAKLAEIYGIKGIEVSSREQLGEAISEMLTQDGPAILEARVMRDEDCYPIVVPGHSPTEMIGLHPHLHHKNPLATIACTNCGTNNPATNKYCCECGTKL